MVSPVRFADAPQYIVHTAPKVDGLKPITNPTEIGPHGALQRPVRDTMTHAGNSTARYGSALSRQDSPSRSILQLVGQLFLPLDIMFRSLQLTNRMALLQSLSL